MHMLVKVHHLETVKLVGNSLDSLSFSRLNLFHPWRIPVDVRRRRNHIFTAREGKG